MAGSGLSSSNRTSSGWRDMRAAPVVISSVQEKATGLYPVAFVWRQRRPLGRRVACAASGVLQHAGYGGTLFFEFLQRGVDLALGVFVDFQTLDDLELAILAFAREAEHDAFG